MTKSVDTPLLVIGLFSPLCLCLSLFNFGDKLSLSTTGRPQTTHVAPAHFELYRNPPPSTFLTARITGRIRYIWPILTFDVLNKQGNTPKKENGFQLLKTSINIQLFPVSPSIQACRVYSVSKNPNPKNESFQICS